MAAELLNQFEADIERLTLVPSDGGRFEISANNVLLYSKLQTRRHAEQGEVVSLVRRFLEKSE